MSEREKENQHRWLKMQAKHAAIQVRLETLIIETNRGGSHPTPTKRGGRTAGGEVRRDYYQLPPTLYTSHFWKEQTEGKIRHTSKDTYLFS